jgi:ATP-dependent Clp protease ATP-binding subunit ClpA
MFERFTERARQVVVLAQEEARGLKHNYIGTEHILLGLLREEEGLGARALRSLGIDIERVREQVVRIVGSGEEAVPRQPPMTPRAKKVLELSLREAIALGHNYIGTEHILLGLVREGEGVAMRILLDFDAPAEKVREEVIRILSGGKPNSAEERLIADMDRTLAHWTVEIVCDAGYDTTIRQIGEWPDKPNMRIDEYGRYVFRSRENENEEPTVIIPVNGVISIELKQVTINER